MLCCRAAQLISKQVISKFRLLIWWHSMITQIKIMFNSTPISVETRRDPTVKQIGLLKPPSELFSERLLVYRSLGLSKEGRIAIVIFNDQDVKSGRTHFHSIVTLTYYSWVADENTLNTDELCLFPSSLCQAVPVEAMCRFHRDRVKMTGFRTPPTLDNCKVYHKLGNHVLDPVNWHLKVNPCELVPHKQGSTPQACTAAQLRLSFIQHSSSPSTQESIRTYSQQRNTISRQQKITQLYSSVWLLALCNG